MCEMIHAPTAYKHASVHLHTVHCKVGCVDAIFPIFFFIKHQIVFFCRSACILNLFTIGPCTHIAILYWTFFRMLVDQANGVGLLNAMRYFDVAIDMHFPAPLLLLSPFKIFSVCVCVSFFLYIAGPQNWSNTLDSLQHEGCHWL